jgi:hypothetical protein
MKLKPIGENQNEVELPNGVTILFSYRTPVAAHIPGSGYVKTDRSWSRTTSKHINQFIARNGGSGTVETRPQSFFDLMVDCAAM